MPTPVYLFMCRMKETSNKIRRKSTTPFPPSRSSNPLKPPLITNPSFSKSLPYDPINIPQLVETLPFKLSPGAKRFVSRRFFSALDGKRVSSVQSRVSAGAACGNRDARAEEGVSFGAEHFGVGEEGREGGCAGDDDCDIDFDDARIERGGCQLED